MGITRGNTRVTEIASGATTLAALLPADIRDGDVLVASVTLAAGTETPPVGWLTRSSNPGTAVFIFMDFHIVQNAALEPASYTWSGLTAAQRQSIEITIWRGVDTTNPWACVGSLANATAASLTIPSISPAVAGSVAISTVGGNAAVGLTWTPPVAMNLISTTTGVGKGGAVAGDLVATAAGPIGAQTWAWNQTLEIRGILEALRPETTPFIPAMSPLNRTGANSGYLTDPSSPVSPFDDPLGQRVVGFRYDLVDATTGRVLGNLTPYTDQVPTITHDTTRTIKRTLDGLSLSPTDTARIDTIKHRIRPYMITADGTAYGLGEFMFTDNSRKVFAPAVKLGSPSLMDTSFIIDQQRENAFPALTNTTDAKFVGDLIRQLMQDFPTINWEAEATPWSTTNSWSFGTTSMQVAEDLAMYGAFFSPWVDNAGVLRFIQFFDPAMKVPDIDWDRYDHVFSDNIIQTDDLLDAPNRFVVVGNNADASQSQGPIVGTYDIPNSAPNSIVNRGFVIPEVVQLQLTDAQQAQQVAVALGQQTVIFERYELTTYLDPRHDSYNVIRWQNANWLELAWSMPLDAAGQMSHLIRKTYVG